MGKAPCISPPLVPRITPVRTEVRHASSRAQNKLQNSVLLSDPTKSGVPLSTFTTQFTTTSPRFTTTMHTEIAKTLSKKPLPPSETFPPIEIQKKRMYDDSCRRFCSVVRISRDRTGDVTEEMSGPKPTFYLL